MARNAALPILTAKPGLTHYLEEIRRFPILERQEEYMLAEALARARRSGRGAQAGHQPSAARDQDRQDYRGYGLPISEAISEANVGLLQAVEGFEPEKGFRFATYAVWWIKAAIQEYILRSWSLVKMGTTANQKKVFFNRRKAQSKISILDDGDMRLDQVKIIARRIGVTERRDLHEPAARRRCLAERRDPRGRQFRRVARPAGGRIPGPGDDARRARGVR